MQNNVQNLLENELSKLGFQIVAVLDKEGKAESFWVPPEGFRYYNNAIIQSVFMSLKKEGMVYNKMPIVRSFAAYLTSQGWTHKGTSLYSGWYPSEKLKSYMGGWSWQIIPALRMQHTYETKQSPKNSIGASLLWGPKNESWWLSRALANP